MTLNLAALAAALCVLVAGCAATPPAALPPVSEAALASGALVHEVVVPASADRVWAAFTTRQGLEGWMAAHADIELRVGGLLRTHYDPAGRLGDPKTIENLVASYDPQRMLTLRVHRAPEGFPFPGTVGQMWTVVYFAPEGPAATRVRTVSLGFTAETESQAMRRFFDRGNAYTLRKLQEHFSGPAAADR